MYNLSVDVKLSILKFLNLNQLTSLQQSNRHFCLLIYKYQEELTRKEFCSMKIATGRKYFEAAINIETGVFDFQVSDELRKKVIYQIKINKN